ncbi:hypothetical protein [Actinoplanes sp. CA-252034]|uniref:hypothetical protein n=1 Tax=Actinoplanes sp. CA-252034 TaxID=3239906 RepID=UPI003D9653B1
MESNSSPSSSSVDATDARAALRLVAEAKARAASRAVAPWWLHAGLGVVFTVAFASMSFRGIIGSTGFPLAMAAAVGLFHALRVRTGLSFDRYTATPGTRRLSLIWLAGLLVISVSGMVLEWGFAVRWSLVVAGVLIGLMTVVLSPAIDRALRRESGAA